MWLIIFLSILLRFIDLANWLDWDATYDEAFYYELSLRLLNGERIYDDIFCLHPPFLFILLSFIFRFIPPSFLFARLIVVFFGIANAYLAMKIVEKINRKKSKIALLLFLTFPYLIHTDREVIFETPATFFYLLGIYLFLFSSDWRGKFLSLVSFSISTLTKLVFLPATAAFLLGVFSKFKKKSQNILISFFIALAYCVVFSVLLNIPTFPPWKEIFNPFSSFLFFLVFLYLVLSQINCSIDFHKVFFYFFLFLIVREIIELILLYFLGFPKTYFEYVYLLIGGRWRKYFLPDFFYRIFTGGTPALSSLLFFFPMIFLFFKWRWNDNVFLRSMIFSLLIYFSLFYDGVPKYVYPAIILFLLHSSLSVESIPPWFFVISLFVFFLLDIILFPHQHIHYLAFPNPVHSNEIKTICSLAQNVSGKVFASHPVLLLILREKCHLQANFSKHVDLFGEIIVKEKGKKDRFFNALIRENNTWLVFERRYAELRDYRDRMKRWYKLVREKDGIEIWKRSQ